jgi:hypothetical protein
MATAAIKTAATATVARVSLRNRLVLEGFISLFLLVVACASLYVDISVWDVRAQGFG